MYMYSSWKNVLKVLIYTNKVDLYIIISIKNTWQLYNKSNPLGHEGIMFGIYLWNEIQ